MARAGFLAAATAALSLGVAASGRAQVVRLEITSRSEVPGGPFGPAGEYETLRGRVHGEIDPSDPRNRIIQDLDLAPRNARGRVEYVATFSLMRPIDPTKASGVLSYYVVNRGNGDTSPGPEGHISLVSGWQGDVAPTDRNQTIEVPVARLRDGGPVTGPVLARFSDLSPGTTTAPVRIGSIGSGYYPPASLDTSKATLTYLTSETTDGRATRGGEIAAADWAFADCRATPFPGTPDPTRICLRNGFDPAFLYELVYTAKDPLVLGVGLAATRDIVSFFRNEKADQAGTPNPVAGLVRYAIAIGVSQSGNLIKTFIHLGFNEDLAGRRVWDGVLPYIAARQTPIDFRFAAPGGAAALGEPGSEPVLWWGRYTDSRRGRPAASLLDRCRASSTCPKVIEAFGSTEFWGLRMSPGLVGTDADRDIPLPDNVRRYYLPGTTHGGGGGGFVRVQPTVPGCVLPQNPNPMTDTLRALIVDLIDWVTKGTPPPASRFPALADGTLVPASRVIQVLRTLPGLPDADLNPVIDYDFGDAFDYNDMAGVITKQPPAIRQVLPTLVPSVNSDGNETSGVPSVLLRAPLGTYLGWNIRSSGFFKGQTCGFVGGYLPFAMTRDERLVTKDPRPSLQERYGTRDGYLCVVRKAAREMVSERLLLRSDADRIAAAAAAAEFIPPDGPASKSDREIAARLCQ
jgi:hypothetical protein